MVKIGLVVPVMSNFRGFTELMASIKEPVVPLVQNNWDINHGVSKGWNSGLLQAREHRCDYTLICNDDVVFTQQHWMRCFIGAMESQGVDLLTPTNARHVYESTEVLCPNPDFSAFMVKTDDFIEKFGWFDENFSPAYFEDNDMARRILVGGGRYANHLGIRMIHLGSVTQNSPTGPVVTSPMFEANRSYYISKWGGQPGEEVFTHPFNDENKTLREW